MRSSTTPRTTFAGAPTPVERPTMEDNRMSLDVKTLCSMITGGLLDKQAFQKIAYTVNQHQFTLACSNKPTDFAQTVVEKIKTMSDTELYTITVAATMETWMRTTPPAAPANAIN